MRRRRFARRGRRVFRGGRRRFGKRGRSRSLRGIKIGYRM